jgi:hypothetical protein
VAPALTGNRGGGDDSSNSDERGQAPALGIDRMALVGNEGAAR